MWDDCGASIVDGDITVIGLRDCRIGVLIHSRPCRCGLVVEWLSLEKFGEVWCGRVWICGADATFRDTEAPSDRLIDTMRWSCNTPVVE